MTSKLTLSINKEVIEQAKKYSRKKNKSISAMVEEFLKTVSSNNESIEKDFLPESKLTDSITGIFASEYKGEEYGSLLEEALMEKHL